MTYKIGSLFDGSGGFPLAASLCGFTPAWASEVEPYPIAVTRRRFPDMVHLGDISKINGAEIEPVDVITFGSPCQDLSVAGKRAGLKHEANGDEETTRSGLFMEAVRIIKEMRGATGGKYPSFALWENVPGAFSSNQGEDFRVVLEELIKIVEPSCTVPPMPKGGWPYADCYLGTGWSVAYRLFDAQYWGVPQRRRRIHLVADFRGERAAEVLFEREGVRGYFETGRTPWQGTAADAERGIGATDQTGEAIAFHLLQDPISSVGKTPCITQGSNHGEPMIGIAMSAGFKAGQGAQARSIGWEMERTPTLAAEAGGNSVPSVCVVYDARGNGDGKIVPTLTGDHESRVTDYTAVTVEAVCCLDGDKIGKAERAGGSGLGIRDGNIMYTLTAKDVHAVCIPINDKATRWKGGGESRNHDGSGNGLGVGADGDPSPTLTAGDRHAVCYAMQAFGKYAESETANAMKARDYKDATDLVMECSGVDCRNMTEYPELHPTLQAKPNGGQSLNFSGAVRILYIVRRLTPTECARLQGFADRWGDIDHKDNFPDAEYEFWMNVRNTNAAINGKVVKKYTKEQMLTWYNKLSSDGAKYKMWGNGIALPPALYVMQGITDALEAMK